MSKLPGRPKIEIDQEQLRTIMRLKPTIEDTAAFFRCHADTIERYIRREFDMTYIEFREQNMVHTRFELVQKALNKAKAGDNIMLIFCLKNLCGWTDRQELKAAHEVTEKTMHAQVVDVIKKLEEKSA